MSVIRSFIAIELPPDLQQHLRQVSAQLRERLTTTPVRWVAVENIHLTLKFLGDVSSTNLEVLTDNLKGAVVNHAPFEIGVGEVGAFPNPRRPRVLWVGVEVTEALASLQRDVEAATTRLGYAREDRPFSPHLTLGRVSKQANAADVRAIASVLESYRVGTLGTVKVEAVHLFRSDLKPGGAVYTSLFTAILNAPQNRR